jgi:hypothetical protein
MDFMRCWVETVIGQTLLLAIEFNAYDCQIHVWDSPSVPEKSS